MNVNVNDALDISNNLNIRPLAWNFFLQYFY